MILNKGSITPKVVLPLGQLVVTTADWWYWYLLGEVRNVRNPAVHWNHTNNCPSSHPQTLEHYVRSLGSTKTVYIYLSHLSLEPNSTLHIEREWSPPQNVPFWHVD